MIARFVKCTERSRLVSQSQSYIVSHYLPTYRGPYVDEEGLGGATPDMDRPPEVWSTRR